MTELRTYSNPRLYALIDDWPSGSHRVKAMFTIETHPTRGQRALRVTENPKGGTNTTKKRTYARAARIVDGDDGRTYLLERGFYSGLLFVMQGNMKFQAESIPETDPRYATLMTFFVNT